MRNRFLLFILVFALAIQVNAKNYYVSAAGNNANTGLSAAAAWQTISKVNSAFSSMAAGDSILFRRGDTFYGAIVVNLSGTSIKPVVISAYGTGAKPVISGFVNPTAWTTTGGGIYQVTVSGAKSSLNMVTLNNVPQALGRFPNADEANGGFLNYESFSGSTSITDNELTSATNWTGAEVVIRKKLWVLDRCKITGHSAGTITYTNTNGSTYDGSNGFGYFFQNDPRTLDKLGEWYFNGSTKILQMYFGTALPSAYSVKVSCIDTLLNLNSKNYVHINNLAFEGSNANAIYGVNSTSVNIQNCDFANSGVGAINLQTVANLVIESCTASDILSNAFFINNARSSNVTIRNCTIKRTGVIPGMGLSNGNSYKAVLASVLSNLLVEYNYVDTTGYVGIEFQGSNVTIKNNVVNHFNFVKDDAGGIYSYASGTDADPGTIYTNRVIKDNIVMNGIGALNGRTGTTLYATGIYLDGRTMNVDVLNNTVFNHPRGGIHSNNPNSVNIKGNTSFNNLNAVSIFRWAWGGISNLAVKNNIFYPKTSNQRSFYYTNSGLNEPVTNTIQNALQSLGDLDSNYYNMINPVGFNSEVYATTGGALIPTTPLSIEGWKAFTGNDSFSKQPVKSIVPYKINSLIGINKFANGVFTAGITGLTVFGANATAVWDNSGKISGGSLKVSVTSPVANKYVMVHSPMGAMSVAKKYVLRFSTYGTTAQGMVRAYIRQTISPYTNLTPIQVKSFGVGRKDHEFLFSAPVSNAGGSFVIELEQNSGVTYFDNIQFYEVDATVYDTGAQLLFEYNDSRVAKTITLNGVYTDVKGNPYINTTVTLQPYTSIILVKDTAARAPLNISATYVPVKCFGDNSTATVSATGGTAPYTGTGTFTVKAGLFTFTVHDAAGDSASVTINVNQPQFPLSVSASAEVITELGGSTTVTVAATGGTAPYTGAGSFTVTAGTYTYTVTDANGCIATTTISVTDANGPLVATVDKTSVDFNCYGDSANVNTGALGGSAPYTGTGSKMIAAGKGSLKLSFTSSISGANTLLNYMVGSISSTKNYVLRFTTLGTTATGKLKASIRKSGSPYTVLTAKQSAIYGSARKDHEFRFVAPQTETAASFLIEIDQSSGTTYIDNIAFFEIDSSGALRGDNKYNGQFEKNISTVFVFSSNNNHSATWDTSGKIASTYYFTVKDSLNASAVVTVITSQPAAPLKATAVSTAIPAAGGTATITVTATGGTAPYTGTGSFTVTAGVYNYTVTDARGCTSRVTITASTTAATSARPATTGATVKTASAERLNTNSSMNDKPQLLQLAAYPNPTNSSFTLDAQGGTNEKIAIMVYGFDGRAVYQAVGNSNSRYNIGGNFMPGVYIVKVTQGPVTKMIKVVKAGN